MQSLSLKSKPFVPTQKLIFGQKEEILKLFKNEKDLENEKQKRNNFLKENKDEIEFYLEEVYDDIFESNSPEILLNKN